MKRSLLTVLAMLTAIPAAQAANDVFYDPSTGEGEIYDVAADGTIRLLQRHTHWRKTWKQIVPGDFDGNGRGDLLFYDATNGVGEIYTLAADGTITRLRYHSGWRKTCGPSSSLDTGTATP